MTAAISKARAARSVITMRGVLNNARNGVEICEACQGAGSEVVFGEICPCVRPTVVEMEFVVSRSLKEALEVRILSEGHDHGQESDHVGLDANQDCG